jgi:AcrR family transcriptional regulator
VHSNGTESPTETSTADNLVLHPTKPAVYSSDSIRDRRERILHEARHLIAEKGVNGFGVRELCKRAGVAQRTLYNSFHSKDRLIAIAIRAAYESVNNSIRYRTSAETLEGIVDRLISINTRNRGARRYSLAVATLYFAPDIDQDIWRAIQHMAFSNLQQWLGRVERDGDLQPWITRDDLAMNIANLEYSIINDWAQERLSDEAFVPHIVRAVLCVTAGATSGETQRKALAYLDDMHRTGELPVFPTVGWRPRTAATDDAGSAGS